jgi:uncharacterized protein YutE (UPF0331/DUF86 family)
MYLEGLRKASPDEFKVDFRLSGSAERYLQVAIECMIDVGNEVISSLQLRRLELHITYFTLLTQFVNFNSGLSCPASSSNGSVSPTSI